MNVSAPFIVRPIATTLLMIGLTLMGVLGYSAPPATGAQRVGVRTLLVTATLPGADPEIMGASVAGPLERQLSMIPGVVSIVSASSLGVTHIQIEFDANRSIGDAVHGVQAAINAVGRSLPKDLPNSPTYEVQVAP